MNRGQLSADWIVSLQSVQAKVKNTLASPAMGIPLEVQRHIEEGGQTTRDGRTRTEPARHISDLRACSAGGARCMVAPLRN